TLLGFEPLLSLDVVQREGDRMVGPFSALWAVVFLLPFFLFVPDRPAPRSTSDHRSALAQLWQTLRELPRERDVLYFLIARALYSDGLTAIFVFGGIYGTAVFGWEAFERGIFGILLITIGILGAVIGGTLDATRSEEHT